jgi:predicted RNase H-like nuclease (RuvC/YqgF family)
MHGFDSKFLNSYLNTLVYENAFWKSQYNNLWQKFLFLQNENYRLQNLLDENNPINTNNTNNNSIIDNTRNIDNNEIISHLQKKNNELLKNIMNKNKEIFILQGELDKHKVST